MTLLSESGEPIQFGPLSQTIVHRQWMLWIVELRPEKLFHFAIFLISKVFGRISSTCCQIQIGVLHTPHPVQRQNFLLSIKGFPVAICLAWRNSSFAALIAE